MNHFVKVEVMAPDNLIDRDFQQEHIYPSIMLPEPCLLLEGFSVIPICSSPSYTVTITLPPTPRVLHHTNMLLVHAPPLLLSYPRLSVKFVFRSHQYCYRTPASYNIAFKSHHHVPGSTYTVCEPNLSE